MDGLHATLIRLVATAVAVTPVGVVGGLVSTAFATTTTTSAETRTLPAASRATADSVWVPFGTDPELHVIEYGLVVSSAPTLT